jgi:hypothetical protein
MALYNRKIGRVPVLKFNLIEVLRNVESDPRRRKAISPFLKDERVKVEFGNRVIDRIIERMDDGMGVKESGDKFSNKPFLKYKESYIDSTIFKIYKGGNTKVNLELTGAMKASMSVLNTSAQGVTIGFDDYDEGRKARGHIMGDNKALRGRVRDFFGLPNKDIKEIMEQVVRESQVDTLVEFIETTEAQIAEPVAALADRQTLFLAEEFA